MADIPEDVLYQGISVDIAFGDSRPVFGDLFLICGDTHPNFPPSGSFAFGPASMLVKGRGPFSSDPGRSAITVRVPFYGMDAVAFYGMDAGSPVRYKSAYANTALLRKKNAFFVDLECPTGSTIHRKPTPLTQRQDGAYRIGAV